MTKSEFLELQDTEKWEMQLKNWQAFHKLVKEVKTLKSEQESILNRLTMIESKKQQSNPDIFDFFEKNVYKEKK